MVCTTQCTTPPPRTYSPRDQRQPMRSPSRSPSRERYRRRSRSADRERSRRCSSRSHERRNRARNSSPPARRSRSKSRREDSRKRSRSPPARPAASARRGGDRDSTSTYRRRSRSNGKNDRSGEGVSRYQPQRGTGDRRPSNRFQTDGSDLFFEERKREREQLTFSIWANIPSPPRPAKKEPSAVSKPAERKRSPSPVSSSGSSSESESPSESESDSDSGRRSRKRKKTSSKRSSKRSSRRNKSSKRSSSKRKSKRSKSSRRSKRRASPSSNESESESDRSSSEDERRNSKKKLLPESRKASIDSLDDNERREAEQFKAAVQGSHESDDDADIGPQPLKETEDAANASLNYGKALLPGEGAAIAQFVQKNMRIPRRGEVGWSGPEIENLETLGYVMSGSRHQRMNAVRIRKENQVYSAEEKRALALINFEEKQQRENAIMNDFKEMLTERLTKKHGARLVEDMEHTAGAGAGGSNAQ